MELSPPHPDRLAPTRMGAYRTNFPPLGSKPMVLADANLACVSAVNPRGDTAMRTRISCTLGMLLLVPGMAPAHAAAAEPAKDPYHEAEELERRGHDKEAFLKYLQFPGGEHAAIKLGRPKAK